MENKSSQEKAGPSRTSDVIILTPDELVKLGLIPEIIHTSVENQKTNNETNGSNIREKQNRKSSKDTKCSKEKSYKPNAISSTILNPEFKNRNKKDVSKIKQDKHSPTLSSKNLNKKTPSPRIYKNSNLNVKLLSCNKVENISNKRSNEKKIEIQNMKSGNRNPDKQFINTNFPSSSQCSEDINTTEEFKQTLKRGLSKKLQEFDDSIKYDIGTKQEGNNISQELDKTGNVNVYKKINITGNTSVCLSDGELKQLVSKTNRHNAVKNFTKLDNTVRGKIFKYTGSPISKDEKIFSVIDDAGCKEKIKETVEHDTVVELTKENILINREECQKSFMKKKNNRDDSMNSNLHQEENIVISHNPQDSNINKNCEESSVEEITGSEEIEAIAKENYMDDKITQNCENEVPESFYMNTFEKLLINEEEIHNTNEALECISKILPKKRKYLENFPVDDVNAEIIDTEEILENSVKLTNPLTNESDGINISIETGENCSLNELLQIRKKRRRISETVVSDSLSREDNIEQNVKNNLLEVDSFAESEIPFSELPAPNQFQNKVMNIGLLDTDEKLSAKDEESNSKNKIQVEHTATKSDISDLGNPENESNELSNMVSELPKKRGRQKRNSNKEDVRTGKNHSPDFGNQEIKESNESKKFAKKRGRPKKILNIEDNCNLTSPSTTNISDLEQKNESVLSVTDTEVEEVPSTPVPQKRGRKKKPEQLASVVVSEEVEKVELVESRTGRKRRKVNYLELANELEETVHGEPKRKHTFSVQNTEKINSIKTETNDEQLENESLCGISKENEQEKFDSSDHSELNKTDETIKDENNSNVTVNKGDISTVINDKNNEKKKISKYRKRGDSVMMLNSVFAAAIKNNSAGETEAESNISSEASSIMNIIIEENNMVTCNACNRKVNNDDWLEHNRQEHNNLAWRNGEPELMLDNTLIVAKILKPILKEDKEIQCGKCKNYFNKVSNYISHMEKCNGVILSGMVTCAVCKTEVAKTKWPHHKQRQHNNLTWRIGERPLNLNDKSLVLSILTALYKAKKPLYCDKCGTSKKSVVGFLSHQSQCGMQLDEAKIKCQFCDRKVLPVSMSSHIKLVHEAPKVKKLIQDASYFSVDADAALKKRKAAKAAMLVINTISGDRMVQEHSKHFLRQVNFSEEDFVKILLRKELSASSTIKCKFNNCLYESDTVFNVIEHMNSCAEKPEQYYTCKKCLSISASEEEMKEHLKNVHDVVIIDDDYEVNEYDDEIIEQYDLQIKRGSLHEKSKMEKDPQYKAKPTFILSLTKQPCQLFLQAYNYTKSFCEQNYSAEQLFRTLLCSESDWLLLNDDLIAAYLPQYTQSCDVAKRKVRNHKNILEDEYTLKTFHLFESECDKGTITIFCGGPIQAMAWMPTPYSSSECRQVLAVAPLYNFDKKYLVNLQYNDRSVIQFWDFGILKNKQPMIEPKLMFCLAHDFGPVWHLEWCPSGCFDTKPEDGVEEMSRMGLLAMAGSDSAVYIYSIPCLRDEQMGVVYKTKPSLKLLLLLNEEYSLSRQKFYATKISWSKASGHKYISVGYTDGVVALFDLDATSNLFRCKDKDGCEVLLPFKSFQPHTHAVTVVDLIHLADGKRWLLTGSFDRNIIIWDLTNNSKVVSKRNIISDGLWLTNWVAFISTADESSKKLSSVSTVLASYRDYLYEHVNLTSSSSTVKTISSSNWLNGIIYCSSVGEITALFPNQLVFGLDNDKSLKNYAYSFGYTKLINKHLSPNERLAEAKRKKSLLTGATNKQTTADDQFLVEQNFYDTYQPITYPECVDKYGLLFCDAKMDSFGDFGKEGRKRKPNGEVDMSLANLYPIQAINKVAFNPNLQASLYFAAGYQAGFVRVTYMKFLENDCQIK